MSRQDESNTALWLATLAGKMELSCPLRTTRRVLQEKFPRKPYNKSFIDQACLVKMAGYWPRSFFASLWSSALSRSINAQEKNLANIQPSWPHTWSISHIYCIQPLTTTQNVWKLCSKLSLLPICTLTYQLESSMLLFISSMTYTIQNLALRKG